MSSIQESTTDLKKFSVVTCYECEKRIHLVCICPGCAKKALLEGRLGVINGSD